MPYKGICSNNNIPNFIVLPRTSLGVELPQT